VWVHPSQGQAETIQETTKATERCKEAVKPSFGHIPILT
jgi:hypothetical protein